MLVAQAKFFGAANHMSDSGCHAIAFLQNHTLTAFGVTVVDVPRLPAHRPLLAVIQRRPAFVGVQVRCARDNLFQCGRCR